MNQFLSKDKNYLKTNKELKKFFMVIKKNTKQFPSLNGMKADELLNNKLYSDLSFLVTKFFREVMTDKDFDSLKYNPDRIKKYGEKALKDMMDYYTDKLKI